MKKGWFRKAKLKWINQNVYSFQFSKSGMFGSDRYVQRHDDRGKLTYHNNEPNWYLDMIKTGGFAERFIFCYELRNEEKFHLWVTLKKDLKY